MKRVLPTIHTIGNDQPREAGCIDILNSLAAEDAMSDNGIDLFGAVLVDSLRCLNKLKKKKGNHGEYALSPVWRVLRERFLRELGDGDQLTVPQVSAMSSTRMATLS